MQARRASTHPCGVWRLSEDGRGPGFFTGCPRCPRCSHGPSHSPPSLSFTCTHKHPIPSTLIHTNAQHTLHTSPYSTVPNIHTQSPIHSPQIHPHSQPHIHTLSQPPVHAHPPVHMSHTHRQAFLPSSDCSEPSHTPHCARWALHQVLGSRCARALLWAAGKTGRQTIVCPLFVLTPRC